MKSLLLCLALLFAARANATYVASGKQDFASTTNTQCVPNSGGATIGNTELIAVQANTSTTVNVSSPRVTTWTLKQGFPDAISYYLYQGTVTSSGVDTITASLPSGSTLIGSACGEWTTPFNTTTTTTIGATATINATTGSDVVAWCSSGAGGIVVGSPFTSRQNIDYSGVTYAKLSDHVAGSTGSQSVTMTNGSPIYMVSFYGGAGPAALIRRRQVIKFTPRATRRKEPNAI